MEGRPEGAHRCRRITTASAGGRGDTPLVVGVRWSFRGKDAGSVNSRKLLARLRTQPRGEQRGPTAQTACCHALLCCCSCRRERLLGEFRSFDHVPELLVRHLPAARPETAVGTNVDSLGIPEDLRRIENSVADELGRLDEVGMDVEHAEAEDRLVRKVAGPRGYLLGRPGGTRCAELSAVLGGGPETEILLALDPLGRLGGEVVGAEAE